MSAEAYGALLAKWREVAGLSQTEAGRHLGLARETLSLLERGKAIHVPGPTGLKRVEQLYGLPQVVQLRALGYDTGLPEDITDDELIMMWRLRAMPEARRANVVEILQRLWRL